MVIGIVVGSLVFTAFIIVLVIGVLKKSGAFGPSKAQREEGARLLATGHKGRAMIVAIQPTGLTVNRIHIQCAVRFRVEPLQGGEPFEGEKKILIPQTNMPRMADVWPCWYDPADRTKFAVGQPGAINAEQHAVYREFGIPHPFDQQQPRA